MARVRYKAKQACTAGGMFRGKGEVFFAEEITPLPAHLEVVRRDTPNQDTFDEEAKKPAPGRKKP